MPLISPRGGGSVQSFVSGRLCPLPAQAPPQSLSDLRWGRRVDRERTKYPLAPPAPAAPSVQGAPNPAPQWTHLPGCLRSQSLVSLHSLFLLPGPARFRSLNTPLQIVTAAATTAGSRGCPLFLSGPRLAAPGPPGRKETSSLPGAPFPPDLSAPSLPRDTRVRESDSTRRSPRCVGSPGREQPP